MTLSAAQLRAFREVGYFNLGPAFTKAELEEIRAERPFDLASLTA